MKIDQYYGPISGKCSMTIVSRNITYMRMFTGVPHRGWGRQKTVGLSTTTFWLISWLLLRKLWDKDSMAKQSVTGWPWTAISWQARLSCQLFYSEHSTFKAHRKTRKLGYRKDDRAMRPIYGWHGCPEKSGDSSLRPRLLFPKFVTGLCSDRY